jgi:hypothetical protein
VFPISYSRPLTLYLFTLAPTVRLHSLQSVPTSPVNPTGHASPSRVSRLAAHASRESVLGSGSVCSISSVDSGAGAGVDASGSGGLEASGSSPGMPGIPSPHSPRANRPSPLVYKSGSSDSTESDDAINPFYDASGDGGRVSPTSPLPRLLLLCTLAHTCMPPHMHTFTHACPLTRTHTYYLAPARTH